MSGGPEYLRVELPLVRQLTGLGWSHIEGSKSDPGVMGRGSFRETFLEAAPSGDQANQHRPLWGTVAG